MGKASKIIATGLVIAGTAVAQGESLVPNAQLSNQQNNTKSELFVNFSNPTTDESTFYLDGIISPSSQVPSKYTGIYAGFETNPESLDWQKIYNVSLSEIPPEILKYGMLRKINEIRKENGLKPLKYDRKLEKVAQDFAYDLKGTAWWQPGHVLHEDSKGRDEYDRVQDAGLLGTYVEDSDNSIRENMATISGYTINTLFYDLMHSHFHKKAIISPYVNSVGFGYCKESNTIIQLFGQVKKGG